MNINNIIHNISFVSNNKLWFLLFVSAGTGGYGYVQKPSVLKTIRLSINSVFTSGSQGSEPFEVIL